MSRIKPWETLQMPNSQRNNIGNGPSPTIWLYNSVLHLTIYQTLHTNYQIN